VILLFTEEFAGEDADLKSDTDLIENRGTVIRDHESREVEKRE